jgi:hypothetical protein
MHKIELVGTEQCPIFSQSRIVGIADARRRYRGIPYAQHKVSGH